MDLTIVTCDYNTPELTKNLVSSIRRHCKDVYDIKVVNTGYENYKADHQLEGVSVYNLLNSSHGNGVNYALDKLVKTRYVLLVDTDVLFLKDIAKPFAKFKENDLAIMGEVVGNRGGKLLKQRVNPWFCFIDLQKLKEYNISFYDHYRTKEQKTVIAYDIGSTMFEDCVNNKLKVGDYMMEGTYFKHYEGMSWRVQKYNPNNGDTDIDIGGTHDNIALYEYGLKVREQYLKDIYNENTNKIPDKK